MAYTCPRCRRTSYHPVDAAEGYCGACHDWTGSPATDPHHNRNLLSTDPKQFIAACLERALHEEEQGRDWLASMMSDLQKWTGDMDALRAANPAQWGELLDRGRDAVQARATELGMGELRRNLY